MTCGKDENQTIVRGIVNEELVLDHLSHGRKFYKTEIKVKRNSGVYDYMSVIIPENVLKPGDLIDFKGRAIEIIGQIRTYGVRDEFGKKHLQFFLYALEIWTYTDDICDVDNVEGYNRVNLVGKICKTPVFRRTPKNKDICDFILIVPGQYEKTYYVPCIAWGNLAHATSHYNMGTVVEVTGRIQSRDYLKRLSPDSEIGEIKRTYEVSADFVMKI